jgi:hypothetical protein
MARFRQCLTRPLTARGNMDAIISDRELKSLGLSRFVSRTSSIGLASIESQQALVKQIYKFREGIDQPLPPFAAHTTSIQRQDKLMNSARNSEPAEDIASDPSCPANTAPSLQRATVLFVASVGSLIGASLLLASI